MEDNVTVLPDKNHREGPCDNYRLMVNSCELVGNYNIVSG